MATALQELSEYLVSDPGEVADMIIDLCEGAKFWDSHTKVLLGQLVDAMPEPDNFTIDDLAEEILRVGTPYAVAIAHDIHCAI
jgi:hypothetical protein